VDEMQSTNRLQKPDLSRIKVEFMELLPGAWRPVRQFGSSLYVRLDPNFCRGWDVHGDDLLLVEFKAMKRAIVTAE